MPRLPLLSLLLVPGLVTAQCYRLVWADEFDGTDLDASKWSYQIGDGCPDLCGWGNNEEQYYRAENVEVSDGTLKIHVREEAFGGRDYTSARIRTAGLASWTTGRFEARMKMPSGGQGYWPAFWMLPEEEHYGIWPLGGEIDIMEFAGGVPGRVSGALHFGALFPNNRYVVDEFFPASGPLDDDFHEYAVEWDPQEIRWYLDGYEYASFTPEDLAPDPWRFDRPFHLLLNVAVGGWFGGPPDGSTVFPDSMVVDYVRVYQDAGVALPVGRAAVLAGGAAEPYALPPVDGASYAWTAPAGATVAAGGASPEAEVLWNGWGGPLEVRVEAPGCTATVARDIAVLPAGCRGLLGTWEPGEPQRAHWIGGDGAYLIDVPNPGADAVNGSATVARFDRNPDVAFSTLRLGTDALSDAALLRSGELVLEMDVYAISPSGTEISINLENVPASFSNYPTGRHSVYRAVTTTSGQWERLRFSYDMRPDPGVADDDVNQIVLLFQPGTSSDDVFWFDNLAVVDPDCTPSGLEPAAAPDLALWPNPATGAVRVAFGREPFEGRVVDAAGRTRRTFRGAGPTRVALDGLAPGTYLVEAVSAEGQARTPLLITAP